MERIADVTPPKNLHFYDVYFIKLVLDIILALFDKITQIDNIDDLYLSKFVNIRALVKNLRDDFENYFINPF